MNEIEKLIAILRDPGARVDERDDAAIYLAQYNQDEAIEALVKVGAIDNEDEIILETCGESLGHIWVKRNIFYSDLFNKLTKKAKAGVFFVLEHEKPDWIHQFSLEEKLLFVLPAVKDELVRLGVNI